MGRNEVRRSQSVVPFGVGSIVEFPDEALMPAGLEAWPLQEPLQIRDDRLARRLRVDHFRVPPPKPDRNSPPGTTAPLPFVRFPQWHFCPRCRWLKKAELHDPRRPRCDNVGVSPRLADKPCGTLEEKRRPRMLPLRFVAVCEAGHIEDFPWNAWAHAEKGKLLDRTAGCKPESLYFYATQLGGLAGLMVKCTTCPAKRSLMGAIGPDGLKGLSCSGLRPWLGVEGGEPCMAPTGLVALQRGASNLYFPDVQSSILIPPYCSSVHRVLEDPLVRETLDSARYDGKIPEETIAAVARMSGVDVAELRGAVEERDRFRKTVVLDSEEDEDEATFRYAEYQALQRMRRATGDDLVCRPQDPTRYGEIVRGCFEHISIVERLAETRALTGFSRIRPSAQVISALSLRRVNWRPAFRVFGEGIFLTLRSEKMQKLVDDSKLAAVMRRATGVPSFRLPITIELIFLHTLAHLIIKRLGFEAGYGASSIRERIYSAPEGHPHRMCGMLLYTAAGDADGTLGGLVELGKPGALERTLAAALEDARWCASDPVCVESAGQGPGSLNIAACHACALLPETSCEFQNRLLDRRLVQAFFGI